MICHCVCCATFGVLGNPMGPATCAHKLFCQWSRAGDRWNANQDPRQDRRTRHARILRLAHHALRAELEEARAGANRDTGRIGPVRSHETTGPSLNGGIAKLSYFDRAWARLPANLPGTANSSRWTRSLKLLLRQVFLICNYQVYLGQDYAITAINTLYTVVHNAFTCYWQEN